MAAKEKKEKEVAACCMDLLHMELVSQVYQQSQLQENKKIDRGESNNVITQLPKDGVAIPATVKTKADEILYQRLETMGYRVGQKLVERSTKDRPRFQDNLEIIKFVCKEFWIDVFRKQIDNLRTNHRGVFVLHDNKFRWLMHISPIQGEVPSRAQNYVIFPCGVIRGALANLGVPCIVNAVSREPISGIADLLFQKRMGDTLAFKVVDPLEKIIELGKEDAAISFVVHLSLALKKSFNHSILMIEMHQTEHSFRFLTELQKQLLFLGKPVPTLACFNTAYQANEIILYHCSKF